MQENCIAVALWIIIGRRGEKKTKRRIDGESIICLEELVGNSARGEGSISCFVVSRPYTALSSTAAPLVSLVWALAPVFQHLFHASLPLKAEA